MLDIRAIAINIYTTRCHYIIHAGAEMHIVMERKAVALGAIVKTQFVFILNTVDEKQIFGQPWLFSTMLEI